jgi:hypothetical protein
LAELVMLLLEVIVRTAEEGGHGLELAVEIVSVFSVSDLDMRRKAFGQQVHLVTEAFHQHACVALDFLEAVINSVVHLLKPLINRVKTLIVSVKPELNAVESLIEPVKPLVKVLNKVPIHAASVCEE